MKTRKLRTIIIDDEIQAVRLLSDMTARIPEIELCATFTDPVSALPGIRTWKPDLLLLDIQMPRMNGFELLRGVRNAGISPWVIFVTAYDQFAIEAIHMEAFDYLMKPVSPVELEEAVKRLIQKAVTRDSSASIDSLLKGLPVSKLRFSDRNGITFIAPSDIIFVEADGNYSNIQERGRRHMVTRKIGELEDTLLPFGFIRISRSFIINPVYLARIDRKLHICQLQAGEAKFEIPVSEDWLREAGK